MRGWVLALAAWPGVAAAQFLGQVASGPPRSPGVVHAGTQAPRAPGGSDIVDVRERIRDGRDSGQLTRRDARRLRRKAGQLDTLTERYGAGGLSDAEARELDTRALVLRDQVDAKRLRGAKR